MTNKKTIKILTIKYNNFLNNLNKDELEIWWDEYIHGDLDLLEEQNANRI